MIAIPIIQLSKIPHSKLIVIRKAVNYTIEALQHDKMLPLEKVYLTIAQEVLYKQLNNKIEKQYPSKSHTLKMPYYQADLLKLSFLNYEKSNKATQLELSIIENLKLDLYKQLL
jgi:hypothetical protein